MQGAFEEAFQQWGLPARIRVDNGAPIAHTSERELPTDLVLWLIALGIQVLFNRPHCPQQNGTVECIQRVSCNWANPSACTDANKLQQALDEASKDHLQIYRIRSQGDKTRKELFPTLFENKRKYDPEALDSNRVKCFLKEFILVRKVFSNGRISLFGVQQPVGTKNKGQMVYITFDPQTSDWKVASDKGTVLCHVLPLSITPDNLKNLSLMSKNL